MGDASAEKDQASGRDKELLDRLYKAYEFRNKVRTDTNARELTILWGINKWGLDKNKIEELCTTYIEYGRRYTLPAIFYAQLEADNQQVQDANARRNTIEAVLRESDNLQLVEPVPGVQQVPVAQMVVPQPQATQRGLKKVAGRFSAARQRAGKIADTVRTSAQGAGGQVRAAFQGATTAAGTAIRSRFNTAKEQTQLDMQTGKGAISVPAATAPPPPLPAAVPMATAVELASTKLLKPPASRIKF